VVDSRDAVAGALKTGRVRAVWLPQITCVGADERDALRAFVEAGGVLIADQKCGERDGRAKPLAGPGMLDDLFGLKREPSAGAPQPAPFAPTDDAGPRTRSWKGMQIVAVSHGLTPDSGKAWLRSDKGAPAVIVNRVGRGAAVFVNMDFNNYAATASGGVGGEVSRDTQGAAEYVDSCVDLVQALMEDLASLKPVASMKVGGRTVSDACSFRFRRGGLRLVAFMARQGTPEKIEPKLILQADYTLPAEAQVYELRAEGKGFGRTASVKASLVPCVPTVFAMLPYEVAGVRLSAPAEAKAGRVLRVEGAIQPAGGVAPELHSVRVEAFRPDGSRFDGFCANLLTDRGGFAHEMPLALDDPAGAWKVVATDVISRRSAEAVVRVTTP
jgi:hypothetical protein